MAEDKLSLENIQNNSWICWNIVNTNAQTLDTGEDSAKKQQPSISNASLVTTFCDGNRTLVRSWILRKMKDSLAT